MIAREGRASVRLFLLQTLKGGLKLALLFWMLAGGIPLARAQPIVIRWLVDGLPAAVEVQGVPRELIETLAPETATADRQRVLAVFAQQGGEATGAPAMPAMTGRWSIANDRLRFETRFPLERGVRYRAEYRPSGTAPTISFFELPPDTALPTTTVVQIFPSSHVLPENQLKFYVQFSAAMSRGGVYEHIRLRDDAGRAIELPFLELGEELWDPTMTRLTLLIDPGRIKRGVKPLEDIGPVFEEGKQYALTINPSCRDAEGRPLRAAFEKKFRVSAADRTSPDPARWIVRAPLAGTRDALVAEFDEPMDHALASRLIGVRVNSSGGGENSAPEGTISLGEYERRWVFSPAQPWRRGSYQLTVQTTIEDLAGNNIGKTFDVDLFEGVQRKLTTETAIVAFEVR